MFLVNRLLGMQSQSMPAEELICIDGGSLNIVRPGSVKGESECIFMDASISIRRTVQANTYQLVVTRAYEESEAQLLPEDAETGDERAFVIDSTLFFALGPVNQADPKSEWSFTWSDPEGDSYADEYEFTISSDTASVKKKAKDLEVVAWKCMFERENNRTWNGNVDGGVDRLRGSFQVEKQARPKTATPRATPQAKPKTPLFRETSDSSSDSDEEFVQKPTQRETDSFSDSDGDTDEDEIVRGLTNVKLDKERTPEPEPTPPAQGHTVPYIEQAPHLTGTQLVHESIQDLYVYDAEKGEFSGLEPGVTVSIYEKQGKSFKGPSSEWLYYLVAEGEKGRWVSDGLGFPGTIESPQISTEKLAIIFNIKSNPATSGSAVVHNTLLLRSPSNDSSGAIPQAFSALSNVISKAVYETKNGRGTWEGLDVMVRNYVEEALQDVDMIDEDEQDEIQVEPEEEVSEEETEESESDNNEPAEERGTMNSHLAVGYKDGRSFVVRGDRIGVFQQKSGKKLNFVTSIAGIEDPKKGKSFVPKNVMLHNQDTSMILQNPDIQGALFRLDLETGRVVDEYKVSDDINIKNFLPDSKFAQTTQQQTFIGLSSNGVFRVDPRLSGNKLVESELKQYATDNKFTVAATTESGKLAVASGKGDIRLFDALGKNAKTALPSLGDAIIGIDVTADGKYVLGTSKDYLLLVDTTIPEGKFGGQSGFDRSFPKDQRTRPRLLKLKPEHVALMQQTLPDGVSFTPAKFNAGLGVKETTILTSCGPYIIAWNFTHVKRGRTDYTIRRYQEAVIADNFKFGGDREIIVTLPTNVLMESKKHLKAPSRQSIVQEWSA